MAKAEIYTTASCAWCLAAKMLLKSRGLGYDEIRVDTDPARLREMFGRSQKRSVPQIFIDDRYIGGYEELVAADHAGTLVPAAGGSA